MTTFTVREGFIFLQADEKGNSRTFYEGDTVELDIPKGEDGPHQLEKQKFNQTKHDAPAA